MRRPRFVLTSAFAAVGFNALSAPAQQPRSVVYPPGASSTATTSSVDPSTDAMMASRPARYLLRNGQDYLTYREYDRALHFFRSVENRQKELTDTERQQLRQGIARVQQGKREAVNGPHVVAQPKGRPTNPPGALALAVPVKAARTSVAVAKRPMAPEPVQLTSGTMTEAEMAPTPTPTPEPSSSLAPAGIPSEPAPLDFPPALDPSVNPAPVTNDDPLALPPVPSVPTGSIPDLGSPPAGGAVMPVIAESAPEAAPALPEVLPLEAAPVATTEPEAAPLLESAPVAESPAMPAMPTLGTEEAAPASLPTIEPAAPAGETVLPVLPDSVPVSAALPVEEPAQDPVTAPAEVPMPMPMPTQVEDPATIPAQGPGFPVGGDSPPVADAPPAPEASTLPDSSASVGVDPLQTIPAPVGSTPSSESFLSPRHRAEIEQLAQRNGENPASDRASAANPGGDPNAPSGLTQGSTRLELLRPPSPTEAQPIRRIPVPEEFVPLARRDWSPNRKYWAAAGTCHMTLYFQDPVLERYGQGVEQALGPRGRFFSYPLDDPKQSNQRNQILQPFYSMGKFCFQVGTLPYKLMVDPPWESEYDLGYYRPGDKIPADTVMMTPTGVGPPLKGRRY